MKKLLSLALALTMCLSLTVPALAEDAGSLEEAIKNIRWTSSLLEKSGLSELDFFVPENIKISEEMVNAADEPGELDGYIAVPKDEVFTVTHTGTMDDGTYITVEGWELPYNYYSDNGIYGVVPDAGSYLGLYDNEIGFINGDDTISDEFPGKLVELKAGQSVTFSLKTLTPYNEKSLIHIMVVMNDPKKNTRSWLNGYYKIDDAKVTAVLNQKPAGGTTFTDVATNSPYLDAIKWAVEKDVTKGTSATTFSPNQYCSITQILTFLWRANGRPGAGSDEQTAVTAWAKSKGINALEGTNFCTRATAVTYMWQAAGKPEPKSAASFSDVPADASYAKAVSWAVEQGITTGKTANSFAPGDNCTRGQIVTFIYRQLAK